MIMRGACVALAMLLGMVAAAAQTRLVQVYAWSGLIDGRILDAFTRESGIRVALDVFDGSEAMEARLRAGASGYDLVIAPGSALHRLVAAKLIQPLDRAKLPAAEAFLPGPLAAARLGDAGNRHAMPFLWGSVGFGIDMARAGAIIGTPATFNWDMLLKGETAKRLASCGIDLLDAPDEILPGILRSAGLAPETRRLDDLRKGMAALARIRPLIRAFQPAGNASGLVNGSACVAAGLSGDILRARQRGMGTGREIGFVLPKEGSPLWFDMLAIPANAPQPEAAHALIAYLLRPDVAARITLATRFATSIAAARPLLDAQTANDGVIYPDAVATKRLIPLAGYDERLAPVVNREWQRLKSGK